jgi:phosphoribosylformylglycinamidine synthase
MRKIRVLIPTGYGENCNYELQYCYKMVGGDADIVHISDIISGKIKLNSYHILNWGGGFLDGDDLGAARACVNRIRHSIMKNKRTFFDALTDFIKDEKLIATQCNGFQLWVKLGILPGLDFGKQEATLTYNASGKFEDRWVKLKINKNSPCIWTRNIDTIELPVRHGEGRFVVKDKKILEELNKNNLISLRYADENYIPTMRYPLNPNGSTDAIAGICDKSGRIFGLMPHPEAFNQRTNHPSWTRNKSESNEGDGLQIFRNAVKYAEENLL